MIMRAIPIAGVLLFGLVSMPSAQEPSQSTLASALQSGSESGRFTAIKVIKAIRVEDRQPYLLSALVNEASRLELDLQHRRAEAANPGAATPAAESEYLFQVLETLAEHHDAVVIQPLLAFIGTGNRVMDAVADFGEDVAADVLALSQPGSDGGDAASGLLTLEKMLERPSVRKPLSADSKRRIADVANTHLHTGNQKPFVVAAAIRLGVATGDAALIALVKRLALDDRATQELGFLDER